MLSSPTKIETDTIRKDLSGDDNKTSIRSGSGPKIWNPCIYGERNVKEERRDGHCGGGVLVVWTWLVPPVGNGRDYKVWKPST